MSSLFFDRPLVPGALLAAVLLAGCTSELTCDDGTEFILSGVTTRYASQAALLIENGTVVGITGQNDRGLSFLLRVPAGTDLMKPTTPDTAGAGAARAGAAGAGAVTLDVATLADGLVYLECTGRIGPMQCTTTDSEAMQPVAHAGSVSVSVADKAVTAEFDLSEVTVRAGSEGQAHGCFRVPDSRSAAGTASN